MLTPVLHECNIHAGSRHTFPAFSRSPNSVYTSAISPKMSESRPVSPISFDSIRLKSRDRKHMFKSLTYSIGIDIFEMQAVQTDTPAAATKIRVTMITPLEFGLSLPLGPFASAMHGQGNKCSCSRQLSHMTTV